MSTRIVRDKRLRHFPNTNDRVRSSSRCLESVKIRIPVARGESILDFVKKFTTVPLTIPAVFGELPKPLNGPETWPLAALATGLLGIAGVAALLLGPVHGLAGVIAVVLCLVPASLSVWVTGQLAVRTKYGGLVGLALGTAGRTAAAVGGG